MINNEINIDEFFNILLCKNKDNSDECNKCKKASNVKLEFDKIEEHTRKKVKLVSTYVSYWRDKIRASNIDEIIFIDAMCNASKYHDNSKTTAVEVFNLLAETAKQVKEKRVSLILNDISINRINDLKESILKSDVPNNMTIFFYAMDVNCFIKDYLDRIKEKSFGRSLTLFYIDPYHISSIDISNFLEMLDKTYSELIYTFWVSDFNRFFDNEHTKKKSEKIREDIKILSSDCDEDIREISEFEIRLNESFKKTKYSKSNIPFEFKNQNNTLMYKLVFYAHEYKGIKLYREALWKVFHGSDYWRNEKEMKTNMSFLEDDEFNNNLEMPAATQVTKKAREYILKTYKDRFILNEDFKMDLLLNFNLRENMILKDIISPMVKEKVIEKTNESKNTRKMWDEEMRIVNNE